MKQNDQTRVSRRRFLETAVAAAAVTKAAPTESAQADPVRARLEEIVENHGSELGDLRKVD